MGYPPQSQPSIYFGERAFKPAVEPAVPRSPSTRSKPIEELSGAARVPVADDLRHAYPATYKALEFIRSRAPHLLPREQNGGRRADEGAGGNGRPARLPRRCGRALGSHPDRPALASAPGSTSRLLKLTPDVTILLASIAAEVTSEANEARRLRALEGAAEESGRRGRRSVVVAAPDRRAHLAGVLSARHVEFDDHEKSREDHVHHAREGEGSEESNGRAARIRPRRPPSAPSRSSVRREWRRRLGRRRRGGGEGEGGG